MVPRIPTLDPLALKELCWPSPDPGAPPSPGRIYFYREQVATIYSVRRNYETFVVAGNQLGKDFVAAFIVLWWFLSAIKFGLTCRIVTTSVKDEHLDVLWGEIGRYLVTSAHPLIHPHGPLIVNHHEIRRASEMSAKNPLSYIKGQVSLKGEGLAGHHSQTSLIVGDECSGIENIVREMAQGWFKRALWFGNPNPCDNFFRECVEAGDLLAA